ncbi:hypothetical protein [Microbacterium amylolyticum]|uniref:Aspartokinase n=1 Tax=Microbacterium amylolyticum TaxID=936337 RepID=A0ABS4ZG54_9MICO|nr:hypothetical protein [Microbacterium amylolyticum]MBP2436202.1 aspartokinase [Microbacterium amylolyticum]
MIATISTTLPRITPSATALDRLLIRAGRSLANFGHRLITARLERIEAVAPSEAQKLARQGAIATRERDNAAQFAPLSLR